jgi:exodeoxyribonuclease I
VSGSFFWYDLETTGTNPRLDRVIQFAGVRTDLELNEIDAPICTYIKCPIDVLPDPMACAVTGLTPQRVNREGLEELEAYVAINRCFSHPRTCVAGFNNLRFDDEFIRFGFYRHLLDPYAREWQNGNSRWDIIDLARAAAALRPEGIEWPSEAPGVPSFRLVDLAAANDVMHESAHDAMSDVRATIGFARLIRAKQRRLFDYCLRLRDRGELLRVVRPESPAMLLHVSGMYPRERGSLAPVMPLARHPQNRNSVIVADLAVDVRRLIDWDIDRLREALFGADRDDRPGLKEIRFNRCPFVAPFSVLRDQDLRRLELDIDIVRMRFDDLRSHSGLGAKIAAIYARPPEAAHHDADAALYDGFIGDGDRAMCADALTQMLNGERSPSVTFSDERLNELLFRLRARRDQNGLSATERLRWLTWMRGKLLDGGEEIMTLRRFREGIEALDGRTDLVHTLNEHADNVELALAGGATAL